MPSDSVEQTKQIKAASDIAFAVVGSYLLPLKPAGKIFKAICPFHQRYLPLTRHRPATPAVQVLVLWCPRRCFLLCHASGESWLQEGRAPYFAHRVGIKLDEQSPARPPSGETPRCNEMERRRSTPTSCSKTIPGLHAREYPRRTEVSPARPSATSVSASRPLSGEWLTRLARRGTHPV